MTSPTPTPPDLARGEPRLVIFFREGMFYPIELPITDDLNAHAEANPGTLRIEDAAGNILWRRKP